MGSTRSAHRPLLDLARRLLCAGVAILLVACAHETRADKAFHELALAHTQRVSQDKSFELPFDAFVVGIEKDNRRRVGTVPECGADDEGDRCLHIGAPYFIAHPDVATDLRGTYGAQWRPTFVSHIAVFDPAIDRPCYLYNVYRTAEACEAFRAGAPDDGRLAMAGWDALERMQPALAARVAARRATHVIVYMMGWNTPQWEALQNYRDLRTQLEAAAREQPSANFRPIYIGMSWPSTGSPRITASDFGIKAKDADETGALWGNILLQRVIGPVKRSTGVKVVVVGHSFGARASSRAVFSEPLVGRGASDPVVDLLVGLQGAYSFQRYVVADDGESPEGQESAPYRDFRQWVGKSVLTASRFDSAVTMAFHGPYFTGSHAVFETTRSPALAATFEHAVASTRGVTGIAGCDRAKVLFVDASAFIDKNQPGTGGGAHSDVFRAETGRFVFEMIRACATRPPP